MPSSVQLELSELKREWIDRSILHVKSLQRGAQFTSDYLHQSLPAPEHPNWFGVLLAALKRLGVIEKQGYVPSDRDEANGRVVAKWRRL